MITLDHDTAGTIDLPSPTLEQPWEVDVNQILHLATGGKRRAYTHGPPKFRIKKTFEGLSESLVAELITWLSDIGWQAGTFDYIQVNPGVPGAQKKFTDVRMIGPPDLLRKMNNITDVTLNLEREEPWSLDNAVDV